MPAEYRYPAGAIAADYMRGLAGILLTGGPLWLMGLSGPLAWALAACMALFLVYFARAVVRHLTRIELSETGITARGPFGGAVPWGELRSMRLSYYTTRSDRTGGWMQLDLGTRERSISIDSRLEGFTEVAAAAALQAGRRGRTLDQNTLSNLNALGVRGDRDV
ncbi:MAG TPA: hypothetical protein VL280_02720 [Burkholderiales bacterium]|jgi:hypothetical protein|nr:hypothetical protein [Burkholderiales bacterium]